MSESITPYEIEHGIYEWHCDSCGGSFDNLDTITLEKTCAFCGSSKITPIATTSEKEGQN